MKGLIQTLVAVVGGALLWSAPLSVLAYTSPGAPTGYVNDFARVLSAETVSSLNTSLSTFEASTSNQISVVTIPSLDGDYIESYAEKLFTEWGIGTKSKDNGILLLVAIQDRKVRIEVGYGLEGALPDSVAQRIIANDMTSFLKSGDYDNAVVRGVDSIIKAVKNEYVGSGTVTKHMNSDNIFWIFFAVIFGLQWLAAIFARTKSWWLGGVIGGVAGTGIAAVTGIFTSATGLVLVCGLTVVGLIFDYVVSQGYSTARSQGTTVPWWSGGGWGPGSGGWSGGSSGGFGGFGGGSSGGGGASGSW